MQTISRRVALAGTAILILAGCGGGSGGSAGVPVVAAPTPAPTPTATPTPTVTYDQAFDLARDRSFALTGAQLTAVATSASVGFTFGSIGARLLTGVENPFFAYDGASQQASITLNNGAPQVFPAAQISLRDTDRLVYTTPTGFLSYSQPGPAIGGFAAPLKYTIQIVQSDDVRNASGGLDTLDRRLVGGSSTVAADVPRTGSATYRVLLASISRTAAGTNGYLAQNADLTIDFATRNVRGTISTTSTVSSLPSATIVMTVDGQLSATSNRLTGSLTTSTGGTGMFSGELYGPQAAELGIAFAVSKTDEPLVGTIVGTRR